jgi:hypothetical protein
MSKGIGIWAPLWTPVKTGVLAAGLGVGVQTNNGSRGFAGQRGVYSTLYNGGTGYPLAVMQSAPNFRPDNAGGQPAQLTPHTVYLQLFVTNANPGSLGNGTATNLNAGQLTVRVCGATLQ